MLYTKQKQEDFWYLVEQSSNKKYDLPSALTVSVAMQESQFNRKAISLAGAIGIMQVMPNTGNGECGMQKHELWEAKGNMRCGLKVLRAYQDQLPRRLWGKLAESYNQGASSLRKGESYRESRDYGFRVDQTRKRYWEKEAVVVYQKGKIQLFGESFSLNSAPLTPSRYQLSVYVNNQWQKDSSIRVFDLYPLTEAGSPAYYLAKEPKESFVLANKEYTTAVGKNLPLISGFREHNHNHVIGGAKNSNHKKGISVDLDFNRMSRDERSLATVILMRHGFKPLSNVLFEKNGVLQHEDNHFDYHYKEADASAIVANLTRSNFKSDYDYARFQFLLDIARARGYNYIDFHVNV